MNIAAVAVAYDPRRDLSGIPRVLTVLDHLIIVDNAPEGHPGLVEHAPSRNSAIVISNRNKGGLAGAYNAALSGIRELWPETTHVLFLDDDTDLSAVSAFLSSAATRAAADNPEIAAVAPIYKDRKTGLRGLHLKLDRFLFRSVGRDISHPIDVTFIVNSMSLWRMDALRVLGAYSTELAVDHIDTEYCLRAQKAGFRILLNPTVEFLHSIGDRRPYRLCGVTLQANGHSAERRYMIGRNTIILLRRYIGAFPAFGALCMIRIAYEAAGIMIAEDDRPRKLRALFRGAWAGLVHRHGI
jgi:rhamnosyltransferase